jgi:hypothetical protein
MRIYGLKVMQKQGYCLCVSVEKQEYAI